MVVIPSKVKAKGQGYIENTGYRRIGFRSIRLPMSEGQGAPGSIICEVRR